MIKRENTFVEAMKFIQQRNNELADNDEAKSQKRIHEHAKFMNDYYKIKQSRLDAQRERVKLYESAQDQELATAIKAIYITALEAETLTDNGILLAEELVDKWIVSEGGAAKIIRENKNKTYLLNRICTIVEEAAREDLRVIYEEDDEDEDDITVEEDEEEVDYDFDDDGDSEDDDDDDSDDDSEEDEETEEVIDDPDTDKEVDVKDEEEVKTDSNGDVTYDVEGEKDSADNVTADEEHDEPEVEDEVEKQMEEELPKEDSTSEEDIDEDIDDDGEADVESEPENYDNKVLEDLDKEEDVQKAVALIRQRVADAEETFIKNNAKDKEQINALLGKISDNIKTVEDMSDADKEKGKDAVAQENVKMSRRAIDNITNNRPLTIMEMFARSLNKDIVRDEALKEHYIEEDGKLDMDTIVESAKVLYGFLETLNTIQLGRKIDKAYLEEIF